MPRDRRFSRQEGRLARFGSDGKRDRRTVRAKTKTEVKNRLSELHGEIDAGIRTPATYTIELCVVDWLDSIERDPHTLDMLRTGQELDQPEDR